MPLYQYRCPACNLRFEASLPPARASEDASCPRCRGSSPRALPGAPRVAYAAEARGAGPQNTGMSGFDASCDRVIGQSAKQGWDVQRRRVGDKRAILGANPGVRGDDLKKLPGDNRYEVMAPPERALHEAAAPLAEAGRRAVRKKTP